jgi:hypothetical protein
MGVLIPIIALAIPVVAIVMGGMQKIYKMRIEEARIHAGGDGGAIDELRHEVDALRQELAEVHERLDFTERLLARGSDRDRPPPVA